jgi:hypothetical protein
MHTQNLIIVDNVQRVTFQPNLFSTNDRNIGIFGESGTSNTTLLKNIVAQAVHTGLPIFGINVSKILDSMFFKWQAKTFIKTKDCKVSNEIWGMNDESDKGGTWINKLVMQALLFNQSVLFIDDCTHLLKNPQISQYLGNLCASSMKDGLQIILGAESSRDCSQKIVKNLGNRFVVLPQFNPLN